MNIEQDIAQVCENGHVVNSFSIWATSHNHQFCPDCGSKTQTQCAQCSTPIKGGIRHLGLTDPTTHERHTLFREDVKSVPSFCPKCGHKFPWAEKQNNKAAIHPTPMAPFVVSNSPGANINFGPGSIHKQASWIESTSEKINNAAASQEEKQAAKSLLTKISENKLLNTILGAVVGELTKATLPK